MIKVCFTERLIDRSVTQVGYSDPMIQNGMIIAQEIKVTLGITGLSFARVHIVQTVWHLDKIKIFLWRVVVEVKLGEMRKALKEIPLFQ